MSTRLDLSELFPAASKAYGELRDDGMVDVVLVDGRPARDSGFTMCVAQMGEAFKLIRRTQMEAGLWKIGGIDSDSGSGYTLHRS
jgi:hypothetical protein